MEDILDDRSRSPARYMDKTHCVQLCKSKADVMYFAFENAQVSTLQNPLPSSIQIMQMFCVRSHKAQANVAKRAVEGKE